MIPLTCSVNTGWCIKTYFNLSWWLWWLCNDRVPCEIETDRLTLTGENSMESRASITQTNILWFIQFFYRHNVWFYFNIDLEYSTHWRRLSAENRATSQASWYIQVAYIIIRTSDSFIFQFSGGCMRCPGSSILVSRKVSVRLYKPVLTFALFHTNVCNKTERWIKKQTFDMSFEQFMRGNLIKSATNWCQCYINIDRWWYIDLHTRAQHQPTCFEQYQLSQLVPEILHLHQQLYMLVCFNICTI